MQITRLLHIEQDENNYVAVRAFLSERAAIEYSQERIWEAIRNLLGENYTVPAEDIDEDGFIEHMKDEEEISSAEWAWYVYDGHDRSIRGYIETVDIEVEPEEIVNG